MKKEKTIKAWAVINNRKNGIIREIFMKKIDAQDFKTENYIHSGKIIPIKIKLPSPYK